MKSTIIMFVSLGIWSSACAGGDAADVDNSALIDGRCPGGRPWTEASRAIEVRSFGYFTGSSKYVADREQLSETQLAALAQLCIIDTPKGPSADGVSHRISITDTDGKVTQYRAAQENALDIDEGQAKDWTTLDIASLTPFLDTLSCLSAGATRRFGVAAAQHDAAQHVR